MLVEAAGPGQVAEMRYTALQALSRMHDPRATDAIERATASVEMRNLRSFALQSLAANDSARATAVALRSLGDYDPLFAVAAVRTAARVGGADAKAKLAEALRTEKRVTVRAAIQRALAAH
ncbi:MAG TPA: HEAT repeat domain-containing protein, partial [Gemmatimonadales bacterium]|nr:HEAT repeat domain-containing protein [Gemmatimonadales bacterium]